jgi:hypothetical protein
VILITGYIKKGKQTYFTFSTTFGAGQRMTGVFVSGLYLVALRAARAALPSPLSY